VRGSAAVLGSGGMAGLEAGLGGCRGPWL
jgi:hypothetical protein